MGRDAAREGEELHQAYQGRIARITREAAPAKGLFRWMLASAPRKRQAAAAAAESEEILSRGLSQRLNQLEEELRQQEQCSPREAWQYFEEHSPPAMPSSRRCAAYRMPERPGETWPPSWWSRWSAAPWTPRCCG